jgi:hypothetical protein
MMRTRPYLLMLGREKEKVPRRRTQGERHLQSSERRTLARSSALLVISKATMLHNVHSGRKGKGSNRHHQQKWMRKQGRGSNMSLCFTVSTMKKGKWKQ